MRIRFRIRTFLVAIAIVSMGFGWYTVNARQHQSEMAALDEIEQLLK